MGENVSIEEIKTGIIGFNFEIASLKTLGELVLIKVNICLNFEQNYSREEGASFDCGDQLRHQLWSRFRVLLSDLITQIAEPVCILYCSSRLLNITFNYSNHRKSMCIVLFLKSSPPLKGYLPLLIKHVHIYFRYLIALDYWK